MCLAKAYLKKDDGNEILLKDIAYLEVSGKTITLTTLLEETETIEANIRSINFVRGNIVFEKPGDTNR